ncbi:MAG: T9SS type A sorting domain-containing protein, partial [Duncaniella sp.]|nr:T9SS type A sorting domain-containing protein [Duncaniella sp.]
FEAYFKLNIIGGTAPYKYADANRYNASQGAIFGLKKPVADSSEDFVLYADGTLNIYINKTPAGVYNATLPIKTATGKSNNMFCFFNGGTNGGIRLACVPNEEISSVGLSYIVGLECEPENGGEKKYIGLTSITGLKPDNAKSIGAPVGASYFTTNLDKDVVYTIRLVAQAGKASMGQGGFNLFKEGVEYTPILSSMGDVSELKFSYDDTYFYVSAPDGELSALSIDKLGIYSLTDNTQSTILTEVDATQPVNITANIANSGAEYLGTVYPYLHDKFGHETKLTPVTVDIVGGATGEVRWNNVTLGEDLYETEYTLTIRDKYNTQVGEGIKFNIINGKPLTDIIVVKSIKFDSDLGDYVSGDITAQRVNQFFYATVEFECLSSDYKKSIYPYFRDASGKYKVYDSYSRMDLDLKKGDTYTFYPEEGMGDLGLTNNTLYQLCFGVLVSSGNFSPVTFEDGSDFVWIYVTTEASGIEVIKEDNTCTVYPNPAQSVTTVTASDAISEIAVYSMNGSLVLDRRYDGNNTAEQLDVTTLPAGNYVLRIVAGGQNKVA